MARTGENIYKRKDGRWEGRYIKMYDANGKPKYGYVYARTYSKAKQKLAEQRCHFPTAADVSNRTNVKYDDILTAWLQSSRTSIKESTFAKYSHIICGTTARPSTTTAMTSTSAGRPTPPRWWSGTTTTPA